MPDIKNQNIAIAVGVVAITAVTGRFMWKKFKNWKAK